MNEGSRSKILNVHFSFSRIPKLLISESEVSKKLRGDRLQHRTNQADTTRMKLPNRKNGEIFAIADQLLGAAHIQVVCEDGKTRLARIPGRMKRRLWIREGDLVIVKPWSFQDPKADVVWRFTRTQAINLSKRGKVPQSIDIFQ